MNPAREALTRAVNRAIAEGAPRCINRAPLSPATREALAAYRREAGKLYSGGAFSLRAASAAYAELRAAFNAEGPGTRDQFNGFPDFLACHDAVPLSELRAEG